MELPRIQDLYVLLDFTAAYFRKKGALSTHIIGTKGIYDELNLNLSVGASAHSDYWHKRVVLSAKE